MVQGCRTRTNAVVEKTKNKATGSSLVVLGSCCSSPTATKVLGTLVEVRDPDEPVAVELAEVVVEPVREVLELVDEEVVAVIVFGVDEVVVKVVVGVVTVEALDEAVGVVDVSELVQEVVEVLV
jgi:hypothetical protein